MPASVRAPALRGAPGPTLGSLHGKVHERSTGRAPVTHRAHGQTAARCDSELAVILHWILSSNWQSITGLLEHTRNAKYDCSGVWTKQNSFWRIIL
ncbi:unnamed protein product [Ostreobium quekettii]|uniref:Uncharacterized protein n=1 Tax=Ostreobium quekettii TaxID=121088 RepID=A0A8S1IR40_9CHLO|nr:unnamed protein product [Ostreobium quekettii]